MTTASPTPLLTALTQMRAAAAEVRLTLATRASDEARQSQRRLIDQLDDYILPRLNRLDAPLLAVVGGSTGAGKSTLVNALVGEAVSRSGVLRPTTRAPILVHFPADAPWFSDDRILPGMARTQGASELDGTLGLVESAAIPPGLALLDAPDVDSIVAENRRLSRQLLDAADMWLFVTTAARYADAVPWDLLREAGERGIALAVVLNRVPSEALSEVHADLKANLDANGLAWAPLFWIAEVNAVDGMLPPESVQALRGWLHGLASDAHTRDAVVRQTLTAAVTTASERARGLVAAAEADARAASELRVVAENVYAEAVREVDDALRDGRLLRGEVLVRWQEFVGTGELLRALESRLGWLRDRVTAAFTGRAPVGQELTAALETGVESLLSDAAARAAERTAESWRARPAGAALLDDPSRTQRFDRPAPDFSARSKEAVREWQHGVLDLVREKAQGKRAVARILSYGVNGAALVVMVAVFAHTGGLTGGEVAVAGGASAVGQKLLEALLGDQAVRDLATEARRDLSRRVAELFDAERERYEALIPTSDTAPVAQLAAAIDDVGRAVL